MFNNNTSLYDDSNYAIKEGNRAFIRIDSVQTGTYPIKSKATLIAHVGPRTSFMNHTSEFGLNEAPLDTWDFSYKNAQNSSFVIAIFRKRLFGGDEEIGEIELKLGSFEKNKVVSEIFELQTLRNRYFNVKVNVSVHLCEDEGFPFCADGNGKLLSNPVIRHQTTYFN